MQLTLKRERGSGVCGKSGDEKCIQDRDGLWQKAVQFKLTENTCRYFYNLEFEWFANTTNKTASNCEHTLSLLFFKTEIFLVILPEMLINALVHFSLFIFGKLVLTSPPASVNAREDSTILLALW